MTEHETGEWSDEYPGHTPHFNAAGACECLCEQCCREDDACICPFGCACYDNLAAHVSASSLGPIGEDE